MGIAIIGEDVTNTALVKRMRTLRFAERFQCATSQKINAVQEFDVAASNAPIEDFSPNRQPELREQYCLIKNASQALDPLHTAILKKWILHWHKESYKGSNNALWWIHATDTLPALTTLTSIALSPYHSISTRQRGEAALILAGDPSPYGFCLTQKILHGVQQWTAEKRSVIEHIEGAVALGLSTRLHLCVLSALEALSHPHVLQNKMQQLTEQSEKIKLILRNNSSASLRLQLIEQIAKTRTSSVLWEHPLLCSVPQLAPYPLTLPPALLEIAELACNDTTPQVQQAGVKFLLSYFHELVSPEAALVVQLLKGKTGGDAAKQAVLSYVTSHLSRAQLRTLKNNSN